MDQKITLLVATTNSGKQAEIKQMLGDSSLNFAIQFSELDLKVEESGETFAQNAHAKADAYGAHYKYESCILCDDSGLVLEAYPEILGVHTSRFQDHLGSYEARAQVLLQKYKDNLELNRAAAFYCVLCLKVSSTETYFFTGQVKGQIADSWREGSVAGGGFGYDGIFIPQGSSETFSQNPALKKQNSHRQKAFAELLKFWEGRAQKP